ncbi:MAG: hypothetical protein VKK59_04365 [Vampirovibrionales bacterium]|nr:hypothetical protein [Vampirovibrionales bacterium]
MNSLLSALTRPQRWSSTSILLRLCALLALSVLPLVANSYMAQASQSAQLQEQLPVAASALAKPSPSVPSTPEVSTCDAIRPQLLRQSAFQTPLSFAIDERLLQALIMSSQHHPLVSAAQAKLEETHLRSKNAKNRRVMMFFRYLNPLTLEGSVEGDVASAEAGLHWAEQTALSQAVNAYLSAQITRDYLDEACSGWLIAEARHQEVSGLFDLGERSRPEVLQKIIERAQAKLMVDKAYEQFQLSLATIDNLRAYAPSASQESKALLSLPAVSKPSSQSPSASMVASSEPIAPLAWMALQLPDANDPRFQALDAALAWALDNRLDLKEAKARVASLSQLKKAAERKLNKPQAEIFAASERQALARFEAFEQSVRLEVAQGWLAWQRALAQQASQDILKETAETLNEQINLSAAAGTMSALERTAVYHQANQLKMAAHRATLELQRQGFQLTYQMGRLTLPVLEKSAQVEDSGRQVPSKSSTLQDKR